MVDRALAINPDADEKALRKKAKTLFGKLRNAKESDPEEGKESEPKKGKESDLSIWLSSEELETAAKQILGDTNDDFLKRS